MREFDSALWIGPKEQTRRHPIVYTDFTATGTVRSAVLRVCGLGLFEAYVNGKKAGGEYLAPCLGDYETALPVSEYDVSSLVNAGANIVEIWLGNGWYKGRFGLEACENNFGDRFAAIALLELEYEDGAKQALSTDESWRCRLGPVLDSGIYDGETQDFTAPDETVNIERVPLDKGRLVPCYGPSIVVHEKLSVREIMRTPKGETVLDFGQNFAGWVEFDCAVPKGTQIVLDYGEVLQDGNFYNDNYRTAKARFICVSDGERRTVRPMFTFFGFRYVRVSGWAGDLNAADFRGCVVYSGLNRTGYFSCGNEKLNRLYENTLWSQKSNFVGLPTDCPQRDERLGWTGDAQVFSRTACLHMDCREFFDKFLRDLRAEQLRLGGAVPCYIPNIDGKAGASAVWGDAAAIIPMELYETYGDGEALARYYHMMKDWVDYAAGEDARRGAKYLYDFGFSFGDWLALDGLTPQSMKGGTDDAFLSSSYWYNSARLTARAAAILSKREDELKYTGLSERIKDAILAEYFAPNGRLAVDTQAAYVVSLHFGIYREKEPVIRGFKRRLEMDCYTIKCGFVGAPLLCRTLADNGMEELAYHFLLNEGFPGWLYCVNLGATTIWERWNSLLPDGTCSGAGMNSFNHYSFGSIAEFLYAFVAGLRCGEAPGWRHITFSPLPDVRLGYASAAYDSVSGRWESSWRINADGTLTVRFAVPEGAAASAKLPGGETLELTGGVFERTYRPARDYRLLYTENSLFTDMADDERVIAILRRRGLDLVADAVRLGDAEAGTWTLCSLRDKFYLGLDGQSLEAAAAEILALSIPTSEDWII